MKRRYTIVNEKDEVVGSKRLEDLATGDIIRASALWLVDKKTGEILTTQRSFSEDHDSGRWGPAVAGTVEKGESYKKNIIKEIEEEIGLRNLRLTMREKVREGNFFLQWFYCEMEKDKIKLKFKDSEVINSRWISKEDLKRELGKYPKKFMKYTKETCVGFF